VGILWENEGAIFYFRTSEILIKWLVSRKAPQAIHPMMAGRALQPFPPAFLIQPEKGWHLS
jgi:hypothetical protein